MHWLIVEPLQVVLGNVYVVFTLVLAETVWAAAAAAAVTFLSKIYYQTAHYKSTPLI